VRIRYDLYAVEPVQPAIRPTHYYYERDACLDGIHLAHNGARRLALGQVATRKYRQ